MFSGFVCVGMLTAFGSSTFTVLLMTGIVIRKMMSNTNMTSTRGVVLMLFKGACSSPELPTCIAIQRNPQKAFRRPRLDGTPESVVMRVLEYLTCGSLQRARRPDVH